MAWSRMRDSVITRNFRETALAQRRSGAVGTKCAAPVSKAATAPAAQSFISASNHFMKARALVLVSLPDG